MKVVWFCFYLCPRLINSYIKRLQGKGYPVKWLLDIVQNDTNLFLDGLDVRPLLDIMNKCRKK